MCLHVLRGRVSLRQTLSIGSTSKRLFPFWGGSQIQSRDSKAFKRSHIFRSHPQGHLGMPAKPKPAKSEAQGKQVSILNNESKAAAKQVGTRRRDREAEVQETGQERSIKRRRNRHTDNLIAAEASESAIAETEDDVETTPVIINPGPKAKDQVLDATQSAEKFLGAVVKVFCVHSEPNYSLPWQRKRQLSSTSSGFIIDGRRILTNAHSVDHHCQVKVRRRGSDTKYIAKVLAQGPECDIALLTVEEDGFWEPNIQPVQFGRLPRLQDSVSVVGFPVGGDTMSVTSGVVSRIEVTNYTHGATALLGMQIDAAINGGNSGGPAFNSKGECVGIAFQTLRGEDVENIGYVIPVDVVHHFITDFDKNGKFTSFPILGIEWQKMESPYMRKAMSMKDDQKGVLVRRVEPTAPANKVLRKGDILLSFDGVQLANDGTIQFRSGERISFSYLAKVELLRNGKTIKADLCLSAVNRLIPEHLDNRPPSYLILAGLIFTQVTAPYLRSEYGKDFDYDSPVKLLDILLHGKSKRPDQQVVVLGHVLAADCTIGYEDLQNYQVFSVNGKKINKLKDLVEIVDSCSSQYLKFELEYDATVIIDTQVARDATKDIMATHCIAFDRSVDLR